MTAQFPVILQFNCEKNLKKILLNARLFGVKVILITETGGFRPVFVFAFKVFVTKYFSSLFISKRNLHFLVQKVEKGLNRGMHFFTAIKHHHHSDILIANLFLFKRLKVAIHAHQCFFQGGKLFTIHSNTNQHAEHASFLVETGTYFRSIDQVVKEAVRSTRCSVVVGRLKNLERLMGSGRDSQFQRRMETVVLSVQLGFEINAGVRKLHK